MRMLLAGCSTMQKKPLVARYISGPPAYLRSVTVPALAMGELSVRVLAKKRRAPLEQANKRISRGRAAWSAMRDKFGGR